MSIFDFFSSNTPAATTTPAPAAPTPAPAPAATGAQQAAGANPTIPTAGNSPVQTDPANPTAAPKSPLDNYQDLWKIDTTQQPATPASLFETDPAKYMEAAAQLNFAQILKPEQLTAISQGGEAATQAFAASINSVAQAVFAQATHANTKLIEQALVQQRQEFAKELPNLIKRHNVSDSLRTSNPAFNHPAAAPILSAMEAQLTKKYPTATASEIQQHAQTYLSAFAGVIAPQTVPQPAASAPDEVDWEALLSGPK